MEMASAKWLSEMEMDQDAAFNYNYQMNTTANLDYYSMDDLDFQSFYSKTSSSNDQIFNTYQNFTTAPNNILDQRPTKQIKTESWKSCTTDQQIPSAKTSPSSSSQIISFENPNSSPATPQQFYGLDSAVIKPKTEIGSSHSSLFNPRSYEEQYGSAYLTQGATKNSAASRTPQYAQDHVIAERKRRLKLNERFVALSAAIPGLKKMDKASILGDAYKYLKHLEERVNILEEQATKKTMESVVFVKKSQVYFEDDSSSSDENSDGICEQSLPEIEARVSDKDILLRIHCEKQKGCLLKILNEIEQLNLNVMNSSVLTFGNATLDITVVAQMDGEFSMTIKDLIRNLRQALLKYM